MFGQNPYQQSYGPANAIADILGAYIQNKNEVGAYDDVSKLGAQADKLAQPQYQQTAVAPEQDASQLMAKSFMPSQVKNISDVNEVSPGLAQQKQQFASLDPQNSVLQAAKQYQQLDPSSQQNRQLKYDQFAAAKAANPDQYVGDTYVGTDEAARAKAQAALPQVEAQAAADQQATKNSQYGFKNPMQQEYGFQDDQAPKQLSYGEYSSKLKTFKAQAMKDLVQKHGLAMAEKVSGMVDSAIQDKLSTYADQQDTANRQAVAPYLLTDLSTPRSKQQALWALQEYNNAARKMGKPGLDMTSMAQIIAANDVNISAKDLGGQIQYVATPKNAAAFNDGSAVKPIFAVDKSMTPDAAANLNEKQYEFQNVSGNTKYQVDHADARNAATLAARPKSNAGANTQISALKGVAADHKSWVIAHKQAIEMGDVQETDDPNYGNYQKAMQILAQTAGIGANGEQAGTHSDSTGDKISDWINEAYNRGYNKADIQASLRQKGYGDKYDSYLWD